MSLIHTLAQGYNARKVISEVYATFVLQVNTRRMSHEESMKYSGHCKLLCELSKF